MERTLKFRRNNAKTGRLVKVNITLTDNGGFRASCDMLGNHGQCFNKAKEIGMNNSTFDAVYRFWSLYHLNDLHAGTVEQENALFKVNLLVLITIIRHVIILNQSAYTKLIIMVGRLNMGMAGLNMIFQKMT